MTSSTSIIVLLTSIVTFALHTSAVDMIENNEADYKPMPAEHSSSSDSDTRKSVDNHLIVDRDTRVLVFGGNGFIGAETVVTLLRRGYTHITIVNRGRWRWDEDIRVKPYVKQITCDRTLPLVSCKQLVDELGEVGTYHVVVDFSTFKGYQMKNAVDLLKERVGLYIYISTDSVYEVSAKKKHNRPSRESDAVRPPSKVLRDQLNSMDNYGHEKLLGEEVLQDQQKAGGFPFVFLRLPDVVGPRDNTYRWWFYQLWLQTFDVIRKPVYVPRKISEKFLSFIDVQDVGEVVAEIMESDDKVHNQVFNLACDGNITLVKVLKDLGSELGIANFLFDTMDLSNNFYLYPSVLNGQIDDTKIRSYLSWRPKSWQHTVQKNVKFYEDAMKNVKYPDEIYGLFERFISALVPDSYLKNFVRRIIKIYGPQTRELIPYEVDLSDGEDLIDSTLDYNRKDEL
ncbi:uncharacterized protein LOC144352600 [Saccoglossus kowalevskii]